MSTKNGTDQHGKKIGQPPKKHTPQQQAEAIAKLIAEQHAPKKHTPQQQAEAIAKLIAEQHAPKKQAEAIDSKNIKILST